MPLSGAGGLRNVTLLVVLVRLYNIITFSQAMNLLFAWYDGRYLCAIRLFFRIHTLFSGRDTQTHNENYILVVTAIMKDPPIFYMNELVSYICLNIVIHLAE